MANDSVPPPNIEPNNRQTIQATSQPAPPVPSTATEPQNVPPADDSCLQCQGSYYPSTRHCCQGKTGMEFWYELVAVSTAFLVLFIILTCVCRCKAVWHRRRSRAERNLFGEATQANGPVSHETQILYVDLNNHTAFLYDPRPPDTHPLDTPTEPSDPTSASNTRSGTNLSSVLRWQGEVQRAAGLQRFRSTGIQLQEQQQQQRRRHEERRRRVFAGAPQREGPSNGQPQDDTKDAGRDLYKTLQLLPAVAILPDWTLAFAQRDLAPVESSNPDAAQSVDAAPENSTSFQGRDQESRWLASTRDLPPGLVAQLDRYSNRSDADPTCEEAVRQSGQHIQFEGRSQQGFQDLLRSPEPFTPGSTGLPLPPACHFPVQTGASSSSGGESIDCQPCVAADGSVNTVKGGGAAVGRAETAVEGLCERTMSIPRERIDSSQGCAGHEMMAGVSGCPKLDNVKGSACVDCGSKDTSQCIVPDDPATSSATDLLLEAAADGSRNHLSGPAIPASAAQSPVGGSSSKAVAGELSVDAGTGGADVSGDCGAAASALHQPPSGASSAMLSDVLPCGSDSVARGTSTIDGICRVMTGSGADSFKQGSPAAGDASYNGWNVPMASPRAALHGTASAQPCTATGLQSATGMANPLAVTPLATTHEDMNLAAKATSVPPLAKVPEDAVAAAPLSVDACEDRPVTVHLLAATPLLATAPVSNPQSPGGCPSVAFEPPPNRSSYTAQDRRIAAQPDTCMQLERQERSLPVATSREAVLPRQAAAKPRAAMELTRPNEAQVLAADALQAVAPLQAMHVNAASHRDVADPAGVRLGCGTARLPVASASEASFVTTSHGPVAGSTDSAARSRETTIPPYGFAEQRERCAARADAFSEWSLAIAPPRASQVQLGNGLTDAAAPGRRSPVHLATELPTVVTGPGSWTAGPGEGTGMPQVVVPEADYGQVESAREPAWGDEVFYHYHITIEVPQGVYAWLDEGTPRSVSCDGDKV